ncbi:MAG: amidase [Solirubrobacterales bacterium]|nr:amidase [Solirubrobacterales bacterium]
MWGHGDDRVGILARMDDLMFLPVTTLAAMVKGGEVRARELVQASLDRIAALDPELNAFVDVFAEDALAEADGIGRDDPRPFAGVPIAIKNNRAIAGRRLTFAAAFFGDFVAPMDDHVVTRFKRAGFIIVGTTTLPEYGILPSTETARFGATRNPWDTTRTPGGSSGGSAVAVASGMVPIAHANDGGGSTRIPAACCGLVGLKPQRGRISVGPAQGESFLVQDGVLTRSVAETALVLDLLHGYEVGDASWATPPPAPFAELAARRPKALRVALSTVPPLVDSPVDPVCAQAAHDTGKLLESLGHEVVEVTDAPWTVPGMLERFTASFGPAVSTSIAFGALLAGREPGEEDMEALSWAIWTTCQGISSVQAAMAAAQLQGFARQLVTWTAGYDVVLTPALAEAPVPIGVLDPTAPDPMATFARSGQFTPYTAISNLTGSPAISLPLHVRPDGDPDAGLPLGSQLIGQPGGEGALLALSAQLEEAAPWAARRAPVS